MNAASYEEFLAAKAHSVDAVPVPHGELAAHLFPFQRDLVAWALRRGRAAIFADTGLGKTAMQVEWARCVARHGRVLILAPLAVAEQTQREAARFGVDVAVRRRDEGDAITIANYEMLHAFDPAAFDGVALDESSILKAYDGKTRTQIVESFGRTRWRLACTATPAPNDFTELGNHAEFLGVRSRVEMLAEFFCHDGGETQTWRLKGHAEEAFWRWVCSWGAVVKRPSDLGHSDDGFALPPLHMHERVVPVDHMAARAMGRLFADEATTLADQRATRRATMDARVAMAADLCQGTEPAIVWCELNDEADACAAAIPGAVQVAGSDPPEVKAERMLGFAEGRYRVLVSKASICGFGMNFQICARMVFVGASHSYESMYQSQRRCWRFGQRRPVDVYVIRAETEGAIVANLRRKEVDAERLSEQMVQHVRAMLRDEISSARREHDDYDPRAKMEIPAWVSTEAP